jgi:hypothetical protein
VIVPASLAFGGSKDDDKSYPFTTPLQSRNYFQKVWENKDVGKLVSVLASAINSMKKVNFASRDTINTFNCRLMRVPVLDDCAR